MIGHVLHIPLSTTEWNGVARAMSMDRNRTHVRVRAKLARAYLAFVFAGDQGRVLISGNCIVRRLDVVSTRLRFVVICGNMPCSLGSGAWLFVKRPLLCLPSHGCSAGDFCR
jgi:hypothetical protein